MKKYQKGLPANATHKALQAGFAPVLILGLVVVAGAVLFIAYKALGPSKPAIVPPSPSSSSVATVTPLPSRSPEISNSKTYTNTKYGYSLMIPLSWTTSEVAGSNSQLVPGQTNSKLTLKGGKTTVEVFFEGEFDHGYMPWKEEKSEDIILGNKAAKKTTLSLQGNPNKWITITIPDFHYFRIEIQGPPDELPVVDQILSSFKFTS